MDYKATFRLEKARKAALKISRNRPGAVWVAGAVAIAAGPQMRLTGRSGRCSSPRSGGTTCGVAGRLRRVHEWQRAKTQDETAAIDFALLLDEAPVQPTQTRALVCSWDRGSEIDSSLDDPPVAPAVAFAVALALVAMLSFAQSPLHCRRSAPRDSLA